MNVHNIMEEQVFQRVNLIYDQISKGQTSWLSCSCDHCRLDTASYVLNRIPPKYIVSGRGIVHSVAEEDNQLKADIDALIVEGMRAVSSARRPYHDKGMNTVQVRKGPYYNFPTFIGVVYDGTTFEPLSNATITLMLDGKQANMMDYTWQNPYTTSKLTKGAFSFWSIPIEAENEKEHKTFEFSLKIECAGYDTLEHSFSVPVVSEAAARLAPNATYALTLQDLFVFPTGADVGSDA